MKTKKYRTREYIASFRSRNTPDITLTKSIFARTKGEAALYVWSAYDEVLLYNGIHVSFFNSDFWELISLKWVRPVRPFDLSINKQ